MLKHRFTRMLVPGRLHLAAHSHHLRPDVTFDAQQQAWLDSAALVDDKWDHVFGELVPSLQRHLAGHLGLDDPATIAFAPNTHELVVRLASGLERPFRVITTDGEFHSFRRQLARWEEAGVAKVERVAVEPFASFPVRLRDAVSTSEADLVYLSHVFYDSGYAVPDIEELVAAVPARETVVVIDGYHSFMALPTDLSAVEDRAFFVAGGYKYAMAGEGSCFMHCPPRYATEPVDTGWMAGFGALTSTDTHVAFPSDGSRFWGATFDPTALYRMEAVMRMLDSEGVTVDDIHGHVTGLITAFVTRLGEVGGPLRAEALVPPREVQSRGHFLTFQLDDAALVYQALHDRGVITDYRGDRIRLGFGVYHDAGDVDRALALLDDL